MQDSLVNKAGAIIFNDISKHEVLPMPVLNTDSEKGLIYEVLSVGMNGRTPIVTVKVEESVVAYKLPLELYEWAEHFLVLRLNDVKLLPANIEFGILEGHSYAEIL